jgi:hypothetical protein
MDENTKKMHKKLAVDNFNKTWDYIDLKERSAKDIDDMISTAHASLFHWKQIGTELNFARGHWQVSYVYSLAGLGESALYHAEISFNICEKEGFGDFDLGFAFEALARAHKTLGNSDKQKEYKNKALAQSENIKKKEDKDYFLTTIEDL